ncbi:NHLP bacteriocin system secretion protein [Leptolyngbya sp. FACHB-671]|uniref:NHLP bacteriocin system secretion protein n=1 Tax=Leptolyngbya sp. FACHB-671 TaxID=2692812 RepID=UPI001686E7AC|nr:NHLP bacteriocin system secretion protein [Leptolyngbya sp. FACHB-671]MBD2069524.1 NHLP bacteriocin system secretion protein [Leptolyngbya sp. FACHB-671]
MIAQKQNLFRQKSLERLSSPEQLDQLMQVVNPRSWIPLATLGSLVFIALLWSIIGRIPITVEGRGILVFPGNVVPLQSKSAGQIIELKIKVGDVVKDGQVIGIIDQTELREQLDQQQAKLTQLQSQDQQVSSLQNTSIAEKNRATEQQRQFLEQSLQHEQNLTATYQERLQVRKRLYAQRLIANDVLLDAEQQYLKNLQTITDLQAQLQELNSQTAEQNRQELEASTARKKEMQETQREIDQLTLQLSNNGQIISQQDGRVLEIAVTQNQVISAGSRIANLAEEDSSEALESITYFSVEDGKKVQEGMVIQITPQIVKRERFGGIIGSVTAVSSFPITREGAAAVIGNAEVVEGLTADQSSLIQVSSTLTPDITTFSGYQWSSSKGPETQISSGTTTTVRVKVEERAPITFVLPILRSATGVY